MIVECVLTVFEEAGMNQTINIEQLTVTLQEGVLSLEGPLLAVNEDSVIIGGWSQEQVLEGVSLEGKTMSSIPN